MKMFETIWKPKKLEDHKSRCIEQQKCKTSYKSSNKKIKSFEWFLEKDPTMSITADFECRKTPADDLQKNIVYIRN